MPLPALAAALGLGYLGFEGLSEAAAYTDLTGRRKRAGRALAESAEEAGFARGSATEQAIIASLLSDLGSEAGPPPPTARLDPMTRAGFQQVDVQSTINRNYNEIQQAARRMGPASVSETLARLGLR